MALATDRFLGLNVTTPASRVVSLTARGIDFRNICPQLIGWDFNSLVTLVAGVVLQMRTVFEIVQSERRSERCTVLHRFALPDVAGPARGELITRLMSMTRIALGMLRHARL